MARWGQQRTETERTCRACGATKLIGEFPKTGAYGRRSTCAVCWNESRRVANLPPEVVERERQRDRDRYLADPTRAMRRTKGRRQLRRGPVPTAPRHWYGVTRAAVELGCSENAVRVLCREGRLRATKAYGRGDGGVWRIDPASVAAFDPHPEHWIDVPQAASALGLSISRVRTLCRERVLKGKRGFAGQRWRIDPASVASWKEQME